MGGVRLVDWCICGPTPRALKTRSCSGLNFFVKHFIQKKNIGASIRIGREIRCLPYARFFLQMDLVAVRYDKQ